MHFAKLIFHSKRIIMNHKLFSKLQFKYRYENKYLDINSNIEIATIIFSNIDINVYIFVKWTEIEIKFEYKAKIYYKKYCFKYIYNFV